MKEFTTKHTNEKHLNLAYEFIQGISKMNYDYIYRGEFTNSIVSNILELTLTNLDKDEDTSKLKKKIYFILVECLQNVAKHQDRMKEVAGHESAMMVIQKRDNRYYLTTANTVENKNIKELTNKLEKVNNMSSQELKEYYQEVLVTGTISDKGGAGLGLISMARKTGNKLYYDFQHVDDKLSYFYLRTEVPLKQNIAQKAEEKSFEQVKKMHKILIQENIILNFSGAFDQDNLLNLIPIVDSQIYNNLNNRKKIFEIMYEMLNNIVIYSENYLSTNRSVGSNEGIFLLSSKNNTLYFTAGNYIHNSIVPTLQKKIDFVNKSSDSDLKIFHNSISEYFVKGEIRQPDLSIIDMKLNSNNKLSYLFSEVSENYSFFVLQTFIDSLDK